MTMQATSKAKTKRKWLAIFLAIFFFILSVFGILQLGCVYTEKTWEHWYPNYEKRDITSILDKSELTNEDYDFLYRQTGLTRLAIDGMRLSAEGKNRILNIQNVFFTRYKITNNMFNLFTYTEEIDGFTTLCDLKDGDILVTATTRVSWWRYGHAAIVVDGETGLIAESISPGTKSRTDSASTFSYLANFIVLRPRIDDEVKSQIANYVKTEMLDVPYRLTTGILSKKYKEKLTHSQCAHFVWYAYKKWGVDLDSNGGGLVKPQDIALSDKVDVVQVYGFDLDKLWS